MTNRPKTKKKDFKELKMKKIFSIDSNKLLRKTTINSLKRSKIGTRNLKFA
jgi:hypothetical protein